MAAATDEFVAHCMELLAPLGAVRYRRMFGGYGVYVDDLFIALIAQECLYLKVDTVTQPTFVAAACLPFTLDRVGAPTGRPVSLGYFSAPEDAMESPALMQPWARFALAAALRARAAKPPAASAAMKARPRKGSSATAPKKL